MSTTAAAVTADVARSTRPAVGTALVLVIVTSFAAIYALSYPLTDWLTASDVHVLPSSPAELAYLVLAVIGLGLTVRGWRDLRVLDWLLAIVLAVPVWLAIQAPYWANGWTPYIPYYDPTLHAAETVFMVTGGVVASRRWGAMRVLASERRFREAGRAAAIGLAIGLILAGVNVLLFIAQGVTPSPADIPAALLQALRPGIVEEVAYRLLFLALVIAALRPALGLRTAAVVAITLSAAFHAAVHVPDLFATNPLVAVGMTAVMSLVFGAPLALLAYRRGVEASIVGHWAIDAVRFSLGL